MPRPVHFEIHASDPRRALAFYGGLFGWKFQQFGEAPYWLVTTGEDSEPGINGALMLRQGPSPEEGQAVNAWVVTVNVPDLDASLAQAIEAGAALALPKRAVPGVGWTAYVKDTEGNILGLYQDDRTAA